MKRRTLILLVLLIAVLALIKIFFLSPKKNKEGGPQNGKSSAVAINAMIVKNNRVENKLVLSGNVLANEEALLKPEVAGKIMSLEVKEGTEVQKGQLIARINDATLQAQMKKAVSQQSLVNEKQKRMKQLLAVKGVSQDEYDMALAALNAANADIELLKAQIQETEIRAPFAGTIGLKNISEGNYINTTDIIASIQQVNPVKIDFAVPEKYAGLVRTNDTVLVSVEGINKKHKARIYALDPKIDATTRSLKVRAVCDNPKREIFPGSYAQVSLILRSANATVIPSMAVIPDLRGQKTYVVRNGKAELILIETGARTDTSVEVISGLNPGDTVITAGIMSLKPGAPVKIQSIKK